MSNSYQLLAEALSSFRPYLTAGYPGGGFPGMITLEKAIEELTGCMITNKAVYAPNPIMAGAEYLGHSIGVREAMTSATDHGKKVLDISIQIDGESPSRMTDGAMIASGIIALAANAANLIHAAKLRAAQETEAAKKDSAGADTGLPAEGADLPPTDKSSQTDPDSSN